MHYLRLVITNPLLRKARFLQFLLLEVDHILHTQRPNVSRLQVKVLAAIALHSAQEGEESAGCTYKEIRLATQVSDEMLSKSLQYLRENELIERRGSVSDRRQSQYQLTEKGLALIAELDDQMIGMLSEWLGEALKHPAERPAQA